MLSVTWVEDWNPENKKGVQGLGVCEIVNDDKEIKKAIDLMNTNLGMKKDYAVYSSVDSTDKIYKITPSYIKYKDDEGYGPKGFREFNF